jgi:class 3 adenylate cyclase/tetratricopeptide (TPR) repeat protein
VNLLEIITQVRSFLEQNGRVSYRMLRRQFELDDDALDELREELVEIQRVAADEGGRVLVWVGQADPGSAATDTSAAPIEQVASAYTPKSYTPKHLADRILTSRSALEGELKQVTVLFADVKGSMELAGQVDPEAWHRILDRFFQILADGVHRFEGTVNQYTGDGIMALFGAPIAHEDHAQRACYAALELHDRLAEHAHEVKREHGLTISTRIGLNSGEVVVGKIGDDLRMDYTAQGHTVGLAARMQELASPDTIYLAEPAASLAKGYFDLRDLGAFRVKGVAEPMQVHELRGVSEAQTRFDVSRSRGLTLFVGRGRDVGALESALEHAQAGSGQVVGVVAEAGTGKSRLCFEFLEKCRAQGMRVLQGKCVAHGKNISLLPILQVFREYYGITHQDSERTTREKIAGRMLLFDERYRDALPLLFELLGVPDPDNPAPVMAAEERQRSLFGVMRSLVQREPIEGTTVTLVEDLHWLDPASEEWIEQWVDAIGGSANLLVVNFRPEYHADWMQKSWYRQLPLAPLGADAIQELIRSLLGADPSLQGVAETVHARTGGNPFFAEETVRGLIESGNLEGAAGAYRLVTPIDELAIPPTVHSLLSARIDRLREREKHVLQAASVIGTEFEEPVLEVVADLPRLDLSEALGVLKAAEFVYEEALYPVAEYAFKHPLTQEVALSSQLRKRRRLTHAAVARALQEANADRLDERAALLAHHWDEAGEIAEAAHWHGRAAETIGFHNLEEALRHFRRLKLLTDRLPESQETLAEAARVRGRILWFGLRTRLPADEAQQLYDEALDRAERAGDLGSAAFARMAHGTRSLYSGDGRRALEQIPPAVAEADRTSDVGLQVVTRWGLVGARFFMGDLEGALGPAEEGVELCRREPDAGTEMLGYSASHFMFGMRAGIHLLAGRLREAERDIEAGARAPDLTEHLVRSLNISIAELTGDAAGALGHMRRAVAALEESAATPVATAFIHRGLGIAYAMNKDWEGARAALEHSLWICRDLDTFLHTTPEVLIWLARVRLGLGDAAGAEESLREGLEVGEGLGSRMNLPLAHRTRASLLRRDESGVDRAAVEASLQAALAAAREMGARFHEPLIHLDRAAFASELGDEALRGRELAAARDLLAEMGATEHAARLSEGANG